MPTKRMLVDATHPEETRVVVTSGNRLEEFDFESASRRQLRGNIYLAKVTRVEPSLQAAFVDYGGNRHGFLAFSEIHPDYYQIPVADREALLAAEAGEPDPDSEPARAARGPRDDEAVSEDAEAGAETDAADDPDNGDDGHNGDDHGDEEENVADVGGDDALEEAQVRKRANVRKYKIQEVIKRRQVMLVQVVKEERGNKGAALTTYLSLAGRYSVLMPNTARGGGISRKITSATDRKRLKAIAGELDVPQGMGVILRTAGASRTRAEVKRDFEYLMRLWENVRSLTLQSTAPCLVYEEGSLIKRTIRDLYNKDIDEVWVSGDSGYREAKDFMRMIMPSHAKNVRQYKEDTPIFSRYNVEPQLDSMFSPQVTLPSGGYIVINPTEALVSIDVNSGRSTKEHNIEDTAYQTNLEAADEVARQLRLRDLAGLIVIDFIDMMEKCSNRNVERRLKDALKNDRARIQVGRISHFGLMEMSRQRMRFGVLESSTHTCPLCQGAGIVRSVESLALMVMRAIEDHVLRKPGQSIDVKVPVDVALYLLNAKRNTLSALEQKRGLSITITADTTLMGSHYNIERGEDRGGVDQPAGAFVSVDSAPIVDLEEEEDDEDETQQKSRSSRRRRRGGRRDRAQSEEGQEVEAANYEAGDEDPQGAGGANSEGEEGPRKRRRRGRRGGRRNRRNPDTNPDLEAQDAVEGEHDHAVSKDVSTGANDLDTLPAGEPAPDSAAEAATNAPSVAAPAQQDTDIDQTATETASEPAEGEAEAKPVKKPRRRRKKATDTAEPAAAEADNGGDVAKPEGAESKPSADAAQDAPAQDAPAQDGPAQDAPEEVAAKAENDTKTDEPEISEDKPARRRKDLPEDGIVVTSSNATTEDEDKAEEKPKKKAGWWQRGFLG